MLMRLSGVAPYLPLLKVSELDNVWGVGFNLIIIQYLASEVGICDSGGMILLPPFLQTLFPPFCHGILFSRKLHSKTYYWGWKVLEEYSDTSCIFVCMFQYFGIYPFNIFWCLWYFIRQQSQSLEPCGWVTCSHIFDQISRPLWGQL